MARNRLIYVTYADGSYERNFRWNGLFARHFLGADALVFFNRADLVKTDAYQQHRAIFDAPRGAGYWAWKPYFILEALKASQPGDIVVYQDCGKGWRYKSFLRPRRLLEMVGRTGFIAGVYSPQYGPNRKWNHRACLAQMGDGSARYEEAATVEAVVSFWTHDQASVRFLTEWRDRCLEYDTIRDVTAEEREQQHPEFVEHRYDQAILTNLAIRHNAPVLHPAPKALRFAKSITMLELDQRARENVFYRWLIWFICAMRR